MYKTTNTHWDLLVHTAATTTNTTTTADAFNVVGNMREIETANEHTAKLHWHNEERESEHN